MVASEKKFYKPLKPITIAPPVKGSWHVVPEGFRSPVKGSWRAAPEGFYKTPEEFEKGFYKAPKGCEKKHLFTWEIGCGLASAANIVTDSFLP